VFVLPLDDELSLALREPHHAPWFAALVADNREHLARWFSWAPSADEGQARTWIAGGLAQFRRGDGWHATLLERGTPVGSVGLHYLDRRRGVTEVGYWLAEAAQGRGLMTRTLRGLIAHFFDAQGLEKVAIGVDPENLRSAALPERLGFRREARVRSVQVRPDGTLGDLVFYGLLRDEWTGADKPVALPPRFALEADGGVRVALFEPDDAEALSALVAAEAERLARWFPWVAGTTVAVTRSFIDGAIGSLAAGEGFEAGIWHRGRLAGAIGVHEVDGRVGRGQIGYWLAAEHEGQGVASAAARAVTRELFVDRGFRKVEIRAAVDNARSRAVPERLGFALEGTLRRDAWNGRAAVDQAVYGLLREEWSASLR
jgi:ribosomal-protein-serine acetyltransferase